MRHVRRVTADHHGPTHHDLHEMPSGAWSARRPGERGDQAVWDEWRGSGQPARTVRWRVPPAIGVGRWPTSARRQEPGRSRPCGHGAPVGGREEGIQPGGDTAKGSHPGWSTHGPFPAPQSPVGLPASGTFSSKALRFQYGFSLFMTAAFLALVGGGPGAAIHSFGARASAPGGWVFDLAAIAALVLAVRAPGRDQLRRRPCRRRRHLPDPTVGVATRRRVPGPGGAHERSVPDRRKPPEHDAAGRRGGRVRHRAPDIGRPAERTVRPVVARRRGMRAQRTGPGAPPRVRGRAGRGWTVAVDGGPPDSCATGACSRASSRDGAGLLRVLRPSGGCDARGSPPASHPPPSR